LSTIPSVFAKEVGSQRRKSWHFASHTTWANTLQPKRSNFQAALLSRSKLGITDQVAAPRRCHANM
jgi:hypothetical protein